jgi:copper(I)-binding protein
LTAPLEDGEPFRLTLVFREAGERDVEVAVGDGPP